MANNHILDWHYQGLTETVRTLQQNKIRFVGCGGNLDEASRPEIFEVSQTHREDARTSTGRVTSGRITNTGAQVGEGASSCSTAVQVAQETFTTYILVFGLGHESAGVFSEWAAGETSAGVNFVRYDFQFQTTQSSSRMSWVNRLALQIETEKQRILRENSSTKSAFLTIVSIHWGGNWGFEVENGHKQFAHSIIDHAKVDIVHGHSSHHVKGAEFYKNSLILYGCGDFISDYEGIGAGGRREQIGHRADLSLMYFANVDIVFPGPTEVEVDTSPGITVTVESLDVVPCLLKHLRVNEPSEKDREWVAQTFARESANLGKCQLQRESDFHFQLVRGK